MLVAGVVLAGALAVTSARGDAGDAAKPAACALWRGKVGEREVAVALKPGAAAANAVVGRYAYLHIGKPIALAGTRTDAGLSLEEGSAPGKLTGRWMLSAGAHGSDTLSGTWSAPEGKRTTSIQLECVADSAGTVRAAWFDAVPAAGTTDEQFEAFVRHPEVTGEVEEHLEGTSVRVASLLAARDLYELVDQHRFRKAAQAVNAAVRARVAKARKEERECLAGGALCDISVKVRIAFLSPRYATVLVESNYDAGGAHPDFDTELWVFEMTEDGAKRMNVEKAYDLRAAGGQWRPAFRKMVLAARKKEMASLGDPSLDDCPDGVGRNDGATVQLGMVEGGLIVDVSYSAHAIAACRYSVFMRADQLAPFLRPGASEDFRTGKF